LSTRLRKIVSRLLGCGAILLLVAFCVKRDLTVPVDKSGSKISTQGGDDHSTLISRTDGSYENNSKPRSVSEKKEGTRPSDRAPIGIKTVRQIRSTIEESGVDGEEFRRLAQSNDKNSQLAALDLISACAPFQSSKGTTFESWFESPMVKAAVVVSMKRRGTSNDSNRVATLSRIFRLCERIQSHDENASYQQSLLKQLRTVDGYSEFSKFTNRLGEGISLREIPEHRALIGKSIPIYETALLNAAVQEINFEEIIGNTQVAHLARLYATTELLCRLGVRCDSNSILFAENCLLIAVCDRSLSASENISTLLKELEINVESAKPAIDSTLDWILGNITWERVVKGKT
jgi:hypothetical protein